ncbi:MAG: NAD(P)H-hydrate dehydratase [Phycisphaerales bacterium]|nr:NAD(P)H-hydrate dehydratase [Phycisphaerales bacterium]
MNIEPVITLPKLPPRPADSHKGTFGRVLIVGGQEQMIGAPVLAGAAALRMGSGLVQIAMPHQVLAAGLSVVPELIGLALDEDSVDALQHAAGQADVIAIGPGMGTGPGAQRWLDALIGLDKPMVIDADGLNLLAQKKHWPGSFKARAVLTPHPGEMKRLAHLFDCDCIPSDDTGRIAVASQAATALRQVIVLKGARTVISNGTHYRLNTSGDNSLSKAGSGDVLTGIIASLIGQGMDNFQAAMLGAYLHGLAGQAAGRRIGPRSVLARDVIDGIAAALAEYQ